LVKPPTPLAPWRVFTPVGNFNLRCDTPSDIRHSLEDSSHFYVRRKLERQPTSFPREPPGTPN
jgi:hypothetical protein